MSEGEPVTDGLPRRVAGVTHSATDRGIPELPRAYRWNRRG